MTTQHVSSFKMATKSGSHDITESLKIEAYPIPSSGSVSGNSDYETVSSPRISSKLLDVLGDRQNILRRRIRDLQEELQESKEKEIDMARKLEQSEESNIEKDCDIEQLKDKTKSLSMKISEAREENQRQKEQIEFYKQALDEAERALMTQSQELEEVKALNGKDSALFETMKQKIQQLEENSENLIQMITDMKEEMKLNENMLKEEINTKNSIIVKQFEENRTDRERFMNTLDKCDKVYDEQKRQLDEYRKEKKLERAMEEHTRRFNNDRFRTRAAKSNQRAAGLDLHTARGNASSNSVDSMLQGGRKGLWKTATKVKHQNASYLSDR